MRRIEELPQAIADYILSSDDDSDLQWQARYLKQRVQGLLKEAQQSAA